jgi:hypothetical protein
MKNRTVVRDNQVFEFASAWHRYEEQDCGKGQTGI